MIKGEHIAVVGAHALDAELMAGGILVRAAKMGGEISLIHMTRGERGHPSKSPEIFAAQLEKEMEYAARILGARHIWPGYVAGGLNPAEKKQVRKLAAILKDLNATHIITHWRGSWHPRHVETYQLVREAIKCLLKEGLNIKGLFYGENCEDLEGFTPDLYVELSKEMVDQWFQAVQEYELFRLSCDPETETIPYHKYYGSIVKVRGLECGKEFSQALMMEKTVYELAATVRSVCL